MHCKLNYAGDEIHFIRQADTIGQSAVGCTIEFLKVSATTRKTGLVHEERAACSGER